MPTTSSTAGTGASPVSSTHSGHHHSSHGFRKHKKRGSDPFLDLPEAVEPASFTAADTKRDDADPFWARLILTPVVMVSFLLSLFYVDRETRVWRRSQHAHSSSSFWSNLSVWRWLDPEPYQDPKDSTWSTDRLPGGRLGSLSPAGGIPEPLRANKSGTLYAQKHRKLAKMEIEDAFKIRSSVAVIVVVSTAFVFLGTAWTITRLWNWFV